MLRYLLKCDKFKFKKICYSFWSLCACAVILTSSLAYCITFSPLESFPYLLKTFVLTDRKEGLREETPQKIDNTDMDAAWRDISMPQDFQVYIDEIALTAESSINGGEMYVGISDIIRSFIPNAGICENRVYVSVSSEKLEVSASSADKWIIANGRYLPCEYINGKSGALMIPLSVASKLLNSSVEVSEDMSKAVFSASDEFIENGDNYYNENRLYWLSRIISAESGGESLNGKIAVGNVVMNRVSTEGFPGTVYDVIFDDSCGVQFTPAADGSIFNEPDEDSIIAAKLCLEGYSLSDNILFFFNPDTASNNWISKNRTFVTVIGNHEFYS